MTTISNCSVDNDFATCSVEDAVDASDAWHIFGTECPKGEIVFLCQVVVLYTVIVVSIYNLTVGHGDSTLWTALLSSSLGYLLPNPSMKRDDGVCFLPSFTKQLVDGHTPEQYVGSVYHKPTATDMSPR